MLRYIPIVCNFANTVFDCSGSQSLSLNAEHMFAYDGTVEYQITIRAVAVKGEGKPSWNIFFRVGVLHRTCSYAV